MSNVGLNVPVGMMTATVSGKRAFFQKGRAPLANVRAAISNSAATALLGLPAAQASIRRTRVAKVRDVCVASALEAPTRLIAENSAVDGGARMRDGKGNYGFDAGRKEYFDLIETGIIDHTNVVRIGLENRRIGHRRPPPDGNDDDRASRARKGTRG